MHLLRQQAGGVCLVAGLPLQEHLVDLADLAAMLPTTVPLEAYSGSQQLRSQPLALVQLEADYLAEILEEASVSPPTRRLALLGAL